MKKIAQRLQDSPNTISRFGIFLLFVAMLHHMFFCFVDTHFFHVSSSMLMLAEMALLAITGLFFINNASSGYVILLLAILANSFILALFQHGFDPKFVRNLVIPVLMIWLGSQYDHRMPIDKLVKILAIIVLLVGLFELIFPETFQQLFNIINFQISLGRSSEKALEYAGSSFSLNGTRNGGRNLLSFLGDHRVSSVFLETVNVSNFSTLIVAWGLSKRKLSEGWLFITIGVVIAVLADSRFGTTLIVLMMLMRYFLNPILFKYIAYFMPLIVVIACIAVGWDYQGFRDDFETRIGSTGNDLLRFNPLEYFGLYGLHTRLFMDQGYARILHFHGLIILLVMWIGFCKLKIKESAETFKYLIAVIISANLAISGDSMFAFKWVAIMWFILGTQLIKKTNAGKNKTQDAPVFDESSVRFGITQDRV